MLIKKEGKHHLCVSEKVNDCKCCGRQVTISASPLTALLDSHLCRDITLCLVQNEMHHQHEVSDTSIHKICRLHHGKHLSTLLQRLTSLFSGPKLSFQTTATRLPSQINAPYADSHILKINPGHVRSSSTPVQSLPAWAFTILQNLRSPTTFKMTL